MTDADDPFWPPEEEVQAVLREFGGDAVAAIRALLHDLAVFAADYEQDVSFGYVRGRLPRGLRRDG